MLAKRIIACLDVKNGQVVKGVQFKNHEIVGDCVSLAQRYRDEGIDELVFYDITASSEQRTVDYSWVARIARVIDIPFCVAGGIRSVDSARQILAAGADKISINSPALENPDLINALAAEFGCQCVVVGIDSWQQDDRYHVYQYTGKAETLQATRRTTSDWVQEVQQRGAGEIVLNCMNQDGVRQGYDIEQLKMIREICNVPLIASGGAGCLQDFSDVFQQTQVDGALAASVFHQKKITIPRLKDFLQQQLITMRPYSLDWDKVNGLMPVIIQDSQTLQVLMLGYMDQAALQVTRRSGKVTFYSRSKQRQWVKGETSGHYLKVKDIITDCDHDTLLVLVEPQGPTCHLNTRSCFGDADAPGLGFLAKLKNVIEQRQQVQTDDSYTCQLFQAGIQRIAQKVAEEGVEVALAAAAGDAMNAEKRLAVCNESADLLYHWLVLLTACDVSVADVLAILQTRHSR